MDPQPTVTRTESLDHSQEIDIGKRIECEVYFTIRLRTEQVDPFKERLEEVKREFLNL